MKLVWLKITAFMGAIMAVMFGYIKYLSKKNDNLEEEVEVFEKTDEIRVKQTEAKSEILKDEKVRIKKKLLKKSKKSRRDRLNSL